jgi:hypothetical protein
MGESALRAQYTLGAAFRAAMAKQTVKRAYLDDTGIRLYGRYGI